MESIDNNNAGNNNNALSEVPDNVSSPVPLVDQNQYNQLMEMIVQKMQTNAKFDENKKQDNCCICQDALCGSPPEDGCGCPAEGHEEQNEDSDNVTPNHIVMFKPCNHCVHAECVSDQDGNVKYGPDGVVRSQPYGAVPASHGAVVPFGYDAQGSYTENYQHCPVCRSGIESVETVFTTDFLPKVDDVSLFLDDIVEQKTKLLNETKELKEQLLNNQRNLEDLKFQRNLEDQFMADALKIASNVEKSNNAEIEELKEKLKNQNKCQVCIEKDKHIEQLIHQQGFALDPKVEKYREKNDFLQAQNSNMNRIKNENDSLKEKIASMERVAAVRGY